MCILSMSQTEHVGNAPETADEGDDASKDRILSSAWGVVIAVGVFTPL